MSSRNISTESLNNANDTLANLGFVAMHAEMLKDDKRSDHGVPHVRIYVAMYSNRDRSHAE